MRMKMVKIIKLVLLAAIAALALAIVVFSFFAFTRDGNFYDYFGARPTVAAVIIFPPAAAVLYAFARKSFGFCIAGIVVSVAFYLFMMYGYLLMVPVESFSPALLKGADLGEFVGFHVMEKCAGNLIVVGLVYSGLFFKPLAQLLDRYEQITDEGRDESPQ
jgi:hypothetical protein